MEDNPFFIAVWLVCAAATVLAAVFAHRSARARYVGRAAVAVLFLVGGALLHVINLVDGDDYSGFADPAVSGWITDTWESVVVPNAVVFIGLLAVFEAAVGVLAASGGRRTLIAYVAVIAFYGVLWVFGPEILFVLVMLPAMALLLRAEHRAAAAVTSNEREPAARV
ncbi:hypothetical protein GCM10009557_04100 [Virgisporangium ochraceum]|uniref:Uncharacterized protein n=1 Tax=Virgisporangium ochraceum TaxID=65505 RepID=A0A8J4EDL9_9ACTN|nr:hypothetical protein [Virgisporangium ochraceum]GIJ71695.1 hypothetical protein Voc01_066120 [Virgisporangium ochraceum]